MLTRVAEGVLVHQSEFMQTNAIVVEGPSGVLLVDAGITGDEMQCLAGDLDQPVAVGFSTHPHWDHLLWHPSLGAPPRYGTARCVATVQQRIPDAAARARVEGMLPPEIAGRVPLDLLGDISALVDAEIPWDGPRVLIIEHQAHAPGHAALWIEDRGVLVAGDMLSDVLIPMLGPDPIETHLGGLDRLEAVIGDIDVFVPGHGSAGDAEAARARLDLDRTYLHALREGGGDGDPRLSAEFGEGWLPDIHQRQLSHLS